MTEALVSPEERSRRIHQVFKPVKVSLFASITPASYAAMFFSFFSLRRKVTSSLLQIIMSIRQYVYQTQLIFPSQMDF